DGLEAAMHLQHWGKAPVVTWLGREDLLPADAAASLERARAAGVRFADAAPASFDFAIDALLGIGAQRPLDGAAAHWRNLMAEAGMPVLAVDLPSGLNADTGMGESVAATHTLSLLALKPGLFTGHGRDACGELWFDDLGVTTREPASALLNAPAPARVRAHASHKGSWGDVAVVGGAPGMRGATLLAAAAALHGGAGRVFVAQLGADAMTVDVTAPELMFRSVDALDLRRLHV
ncbi:MAG: NAD(P)H-hydrate epimerase, partial [Pseudomonadota bacterium]